MGKIRLISEDLDRELMRIQMVLSKINPDKEIKLVTATKIGAEIISQNLSNYLKKLKKWGKI